MGAKVVDVDGNAKGLRYFLRCTLYIHDELSTFDG